MRNIILVLMTTIFSASTSAQVQINAEDAKDHIGEVVTLCGKVFSGRYLQNANNQPTLLNLGGEYPKQLVTIAIFEVDRKNFPFKPEEYYPNLDICVTGKLIMYKSMPEIIVQSSDQIKLQIDNGEKSTDNPIQKPVKFKGPPDKLKTPPEKVKNTRQEDDIKLSSDVHLRSGPGLAFDPLIILGTGSVVTVLKSNNGWSYVSVKKQIGTSAKTENGYIKNSVLQ